jgi:hypothetical protein
MTVGELKEKLEQFPDDLHVFVPNVFYGMGEKEPDAVMARSVYRGVNEFDRCLFIDECVEVEDEDFSR